MRAKNKKLKELIAKKAMKILILFSLAAIIGCAKGTLPILEKIQTLKGNTEDLKSKECSKLAASTFGKKYPELYSSLFADAVQFDRLSFVNIDGQCSDFFEYLYFYTSKLNELKILVQIFPDIPREFDYEMGNKNSLVITFKSLDSNEAFLSNMDKETNELIINSNYKFKMDGGKNFLKILSLYHSKIRLEGTNGMYKSFSVQIPPDDIYRISTDAILLIKRGADVFSLNSKIFEIYNHRGDKMLNTLTIKPDYSSSDLVSCSEEELQNEGSAYTRCTYSLSEKDFNEGDKLACAIDKIISQNDFINMRGQDLRYYFLNLDDHCKI
ncbi:MAG: hypothetical protein ACXVLQ_18580 [Bacteriovorax sp.]